MATKEKLDLYRVHKTDYAAPKKPVLLEIASAQYLAIDGCGAPKDVQFQDSIGALYGVAFTVKMTNKSRGRDYTVCKLEALWWIDGNKPFHDAIPDEIHYELLIRTPNFIRNSHIAEAQGALADRGKSPRVRDIKLETLREGRCVQMLHVGPYDHEDVTIERMREFASDKGLSLAGRHHEIYLSDPRRVSPERLRTILRFPVKREDVGR
jgi:hypothetical protein